jgi:molybdopterin synthase catalytic subunit
MIMEASAAANQHPDKQVLATVTAFPLKLDELVRFVGSPAAGAISTFSGVTRNNFEGKEVLRLEYEAYVPMAMKKLEVTISKIKQLQCHPLLSIDGWLRLQEICFEIKKRWSVTGVAIAHRVGIVEVGEPSVIIAVSSAHRHNSLQVGFATLPCHEEHLAGRDAGPMCHTAYDTALMQAVAWAIDELKAVVPIWKKEFFTDGSMVSSMLLHVCSLADARSSSTLRCQSCLSLTWLLLACLHSGRRMLRAGQGCLQVMHPDRQCSGPCSSWPFSQHTMPCHMLVPRQHHTQPILHPVKDSLLPGLLHNQVHSRIHLLSRGMPPHTQAQGAPPVLLINLQASTTEQAQGGRGSRLGQ